METLTTVIIVTVTVLALVYVFSKRRKDPSNDDLDGDDRRDVPLLETPLILSDFKIYNYLPTKSISIDVLPRNEDCLTTGKRKLLIREVRPKKYSGIYLNQVLEDLKPGNILRIYVFPPGHPEERVEYADYVVTTRNDERIKALHIGMVTTRFIGDAWANNTNVTKVANAGPKGNIYLDIHNTTNLPISLNERKIHVPPHGTARVLGINDRNDGIPLGMWFRDDDGMYPTYQQLKPYSDLYYLAASDVQQPIQGTWNIEFTDEIDPSSTLWAFEDGVY